MSAPCDPEANPKPREEEQEIVLRLGDILPRVPAHLLKPGPHDATSQVRFSVDELAGKIARGRVSVPIERLASACPDAFREGADFSSEQEIQLPLQKLLEQVGLVAPKPPAPILIPAEQLARARAQAGRIIETAKTTPAADEKAPQTTPDAPRSGSPNQGMDGTQGTQPPAEAVAEPVHPGNISLRALPIFRLLPAEIVQPGALPSEAVRVTLPMAGIDPQLACGHVEIPLEEFIKALPDDLRQTVRQVPGTQVWIPLDEIFHSLPPDHLFYLPPIPLAEGTENASPVAEPAEPVPEPEAAAGSIPEPAPAGEALSPQPVPEPPVPTSDPPPSRAPWMRGFQIPPPRLLAIGKPSAGSPSKPAPAEPNPLPPPPTPEARRTADFLASQPGIFAAAAFVQGAVFASADFPRKPDLDELRDFMGAFVDRARESGLRLGWNRVVTIACEKFHATAAVRESHFIVALHHDRMLAPLAYDALLAAADDLSKTDG